MADALVILFPDGEGAGEGPLSTDHSGAISLAQSLGDVELLVISGKAEDQLSRCAGYDVASVRAITLPGEADPFPVLLANISDDRKRCVFMAHGENERMRNLPYRLAAATRWPLVAQARSCASNGGQFVLERQLGKAAVEQVLCESPAIVTSAATTPAMWSHGRMLRAQRDLPVSAITALNCDEAHSKWWTPDDNQPLRHWIAQPVGSVKQRVGQIRGTARSAGEIVNATTPEDGAKAIISYLKRNRLLKEQHDD